VLSLGLGITTSQQLRGTTAFTLASLFSGGRDGVLDDPSDLTTRSQDAAGTTPVVALDDPVGLALEKHAGLTLGPELVSDPEFNDPAHWTPQNPAWLVSGGKATYTNEEGLSYLETVADLTFTAGVFYEVSFTLDDVTAQSFAVIIGFFNKTATVNLFGSYQSFNDGGKKVLYFTPSTTVTGLRIYGNNDSKDLSWSLLDISVRELPGNHFTQSSASFRPLSKLTYDQYDGSDDRMAGVYAPTAAGTIIARFNGATAGRYIYGSHDGSNGRCYLGLDSSGKLAAGIGAQGTSTIVAGSDLRNGWHTGAVIWDGTTVKLYLNGAEIYSAAQSGSVNTTVPIYRGCINSNGTPAAFWDGGIGESLIIDRALTADEILKTTNKWST